MYLGRESCSVDSTHTRPVLCHDFVDGSSLYTVQNEIAKSRDEMSIGEYGDSLLYTMSFLSFLSGIAPARERT